MAELYVNFSQNYRAINFSDLRIQNPNFVVDSTLTDERGYTADLGIRGSREGAFSYELTAFYLHYNNRIGQVLRADQPPLYLDYRLRTNVAASRSIGLEGFASLNFANHLRRWLPRGDLTGYLNASLLHTRYVRSKDSSIEGKEVEMAPPYIIRSGINWKAGRWKAGAQMSHVARHFSDATNAVRTSTAVEGIIPAYSVADLTLGLRLTGWLSLEASCNNLLDARYFTRRAEAYPGPGIIPSDGRSFFLTVEVKWQ
jgi:Fe(3+) dicitrate transport protein